MDIFDATCGDAGWWVRERRGLAVPAAAGIEWPIASVTIFGGVEVFTTGGVWGDGGIPEVKG